MLSHEKELAKIIRIGREAFETQSEGTGRDAARALEDANRRVDCLTEVRHRVLHALNLAECDRRDFHRNMRRGNNWRAIIKRYVRTT